MWKQGVTEVTSKELELIFINTRLGIIDLLNFKLKQIGISQNYRISLQDKEKGADGKWMNSSIDLSKVLLVLQEYHLTTENLEASNETKLNGELESHFKKYFENVSKSSGKIRGLFDSVVGEMDFVIEVKLAASLKSSGQRHRASGQIKQYLEEIGSRNFLLLVIGNEEMKQEKNVKSLEKEVLEDFKCYVTLVLLNALSEYSF